MQRSLFLLILMGQCFFVMCQLYEYHFINDPMTWEKARNHCRAKYTDLATVCKVTDMNGLPDNDVVVWIRLYNNLTSTNMWFWSLPKVEFHEKEKKLDDDQDAKKNCVFFKNGVMKNEKCQKQKQFTCCKKSSSSSRNMICKSMDMKKSWPEAQKYCRDNCMDLVSGDTQIQKVFSQNSNYDSWIGLYRDFWRWSDGSSYNLRDCDQMKCEDPDKCVSIKSGGWKSGDCNEEKPFFCYKDKIKLINENKTWQEAMDYCRENHNDLISITDEHQQRWVQERAKEAQTEFIWLGLRYTCTLDMWFWVTGEDVVYENWESYPPTHGCYSGAAMKTDEENKWVTQRDNETFNFICTL